MSKDESKCGGNAGTPPQWRDTEAFKPFNGTSGSAIFPCDNNQVTVIRALPPGVYELSYIGKTAGVIVAAIVNADQYGPGTARTDVIKDPAVVAFEATASLLLGVKTFDASDNEVIALDRCGNMNNLGFVCDDPAGPGHLVVAYLRDLPKSQLRQG